ncbi:uncharacterized protein [Palaemon carinicauda]|uniref:uncharacterized protein n=1 Tax=Palaemon carinicauda TaxID=392227 RepID=UPI0035B5E722
MLKFVFLFLVVLAVNGDTQNDTARTINLFPWLLNRPAFTGWGGVGGRPPYTAGGWGAWPPYTEGNTSWVPSDCRYRCRDPYGRLYCCESTTAYPMFHAYQTTKPGNCPSVHPQCPPVRGGPPRRCSQDRSCLGMDKCCYDSCLGHHVCKPPQYSG